MTRQERRLAICLKLAGGLFLAFCVSYIVLGLTGTSDYPFTANSTAKDGLFALAAFIGASDVRRHLWAPVVITIGHFVIVAMLALMLLTGNADATQHTLGTPPLNLSAEAFAVIWMVAATGIGVLFWVLRRSALKARFDLRYLGPAEFLTLAALSEALIEGEMAVPPYEVAQNTDRYLHDFDAQGKWRIRLALFVLSFIPLLTLSAPFPEMSLENRHKFLQKRFLTSVSRRWLPEFLRIAQQSMIRAASQMSYIGYYRDKRSYPECEYRPFGDRPEIARRMAKYPSPPPARLEVLLPGNVSDGFLSADVVIVGSGAGAATVAKGLLDPRRGKDREVLLIERGQHVDPTQFSPDEATQLARLYRDGALTLTTDYRFQVLQGMCVGGSTVVNNAVCFDLPPGILARWQGDGYEAGLREADLAASFKRLHDELPVIEQDDPRRANGGAGPFLDGLRALQLDGPPYKSGPVAANIKDCLGCGDCNSGCAHGRKLSMLDKTLPRLQAAHGSEAMRVLAETQVLEVLHTGSRATGVRCRMSDGRTIDVRANTVIVAAGALASSVILRRSGIGGDRVGTGLAFNLACPIVCDFEKPVRSGEGLAISHYLTLPGDGVALETWYQPLLGMALFMPGWFADHQFNMRRYQHLTAVGVVIGSDNGGSVRPTRLSKRAVAFKYRPSERDMKLMLEGIKLASRVMLAGGATRVMPPTFDYTELRHVDQMDEYLDRIRDNSDLTLNSAHPQSGNPISTNSAKGVVDSDLRAHGFDNLYVTDASVFPTAVTVNPQLTVMALADYAVDGIG